jgi:VWFA-related protein
MRWMKCCKKTARRASLQRAAFPVLFFVVFCAPAFSQETTLRSQSNVVLIPALVKDSDGGVVYGLQAKDFVIEDDGAEQTVHLDEAPEGQPVSLVIAVQRGRRANYEFPRMQGLASMLDPILRQGQTRAALIEFDSAVEVTRNFTQDPSLIPDDLKNLQAGDGGAAILDAVDAAVTLLKKEPEDRLRVLLLISETRDHGSHVKIEDAVSAIGRSNAVMYALAFSPALSNILDTGRGTNKNEMHNGVNVLDLAYQVAQAMRKNVPSAVAEMTGGEYELFATRKKFEVRMNDFTNHLHNRYSLSIEPKNPHPGLHQIRVRLKSGAMDSVLARTSYWAEGTTAEKTSPKD